MSILYKIVTTHYLFAAFTFLVLAPMLLFSVADFGGHYFQPHLLAITHTAALGWATIIIFGACYQLLPLILDNKLYSYKLAWFSFGTFCLGLIDFVYSFWVFEPGLHMQCGSLLLQTGISAFAINIFLTARKIKIPDICQDFILTACIWLLVTAVLGVLMVFNFRYAFLPEDHLLYLKLHAHAGLGGWFLLLIIGVGTKLLKELFVVEKPSTALLQWSYYLINAALLTFFINTYVFGINNITYFIALIALAGMACWLVYVFRYFGTRILPKIDASSVHTLLAGILLVVAIFVLPFIIFYQLRADVLAVRLTTLYGTLLLFGWITSLILGQTFKILPLVSHRNEDPDLLNFNESLLSIKLYNNNILRIQFLSFLLFIIGFSTGVVLGNKFLIYSGLICFTITALLYISNIFIVLFKLKERDFVENDKHRITI